jgi:alpha-L-arabinofuranosidase
MNAKRLASVTLSLLLAASLRASTATITIDASQKGPAINPRMYGIFLEEINHGVDGGLYAELIRNRGFEDSRPPEGFTKRDGRWLDAKGYDAGFDQFGYTTEGIPFWSLLKEGNAKGAMSLETTGGITEQSRHCLRLDIEDPADGSVGVANTGFFGIGLQQDQKYNLSLYVKARVAAASDSLPMASSSMKDSSSLVIHLEDFSGNALSDVVRIEGIGSNWRQFKATLTASATQSKARLVILAQAKGTLWLDFVSLFPATTWKGRPNGLRPDIAQMIADLKPGFVRFPGGCVVEGGTVETAYNWKRTVGPLENRQECWGPWNYRFTHGLGLHEYLQFCEDLGAEPLWVGFCGQTCIFRQMENVPMDEMGPVRDGFLDVVEYANGPMDSQWGKLRAEAGHPEPFNLKYVEIGNENAEKAYEERYRFIYEAMKEKYPDLVYFADLSYYRMPPELYQIADRHYYNNPAWFLNRFNEYDTRDRNLAPLYLGEVAVTSQDGGRYRGNLLAALAEGVYLMGCERNANAVQMVSYAPLLAHVDGRTWDWHGMIYHDGTRVFGTVSYYLWKLFGLNRPTYTVRTDLKLEAAKPPSIAGAIGVGTWNTSAEFKDIRVERDGKFLYASDFATGAVDWRQDGGEWTVRDGAYRQDRHAVGLSYVGDETWSDYTLTLKARKISGPEGFLVVFGRKDQSKFWWNVGGWGNTQHAVELNQSPVGRNVRGRIETDRWYDIKVELAGNRIRCYLDGTLIHDAAAPATEHFYATAGRDEANGDLVVKAINTAAEPVAARLTLQGLDSVKPDATVTVLTSENLADNNSLDEPTRVTPAESRVNATAGGFTHEFPARSLTVLRIRTR